MSSIQTGIELNDHFSSVLYSVINSVNLAVSAMYDMQQSMNADIDTSSIEGARDEINQATAAIIAMNEALNNQVVHDSAVPSEPVRIPVQWETGGLEVFTSTGVERFEQEVQRINSILEQLGSTQDAIAQQAYNTNIFPPEAFQDLSRLAVRIDEIRGRIQQIENNPVNIGTDSASAELEQLYAQLYRMTQEQTELNQAVQNMDISAANDAYLRLSHTVSGTERYIRDNVDEQGRFNQEIQEGTQQANELTNMIGNAITAYVSIQSAERALNISDELTQTVARLNLMNDGAQTTQELFDKIYLSAQQTHSPLMETANAIAKMGNNAGAAFSGNDELIAFMGQVNKQFVIGGASATEQSNAMMQLSQAMASGALRGDELNSILDAAPGIARTIEKSMGWAEGSIKSYAEEGQVTAEVVKTSLLNMADETNAAFESMPITFSQAMTDFDSSVQRAFQPVLQRLNDIANSEAFQAFVNGAIEAMATLANVVLNIFELIGTVGGFIADNWSILSPVVYGAATALAVYYGASLLAKDGAIMSAIAAGKDAAAKGAQAVATFAATVSQEGLNAAIAACPITWIIIAVIALIAVVMMLCNWIAEATGAADSGIGIVVGLLAVAAAFIGNLFVTLINTVIDIFVVLWNFIAAFVNFFANTFTDPVGAIARLFFDLVDCILSLLQTLAGAIDTIFGSNLSSSVQGWRDSLSGMVDETFGQGEEIMAVISGEAWHVDRFEYGGAFDAGAAVGDGIASAIDNSSLSDIFGKVYIPNPADYASQFDGISDNLGSITEDTGAIKDSVSISEEDLKYLRDIAEQEAVNRFTTAEIKVDMSGMRNTVNNNGDLDGFVSGLTDAVNEAIDNMTEGVHE